MKNLTTLSPRRLLFLLALVCGVFLSLSSLTPAQTPDAEQRTKAIELIKELKFTEALPILEKIVKAQPDDREAHFYLGFALLGKAKNTEDAAAAKELRKRAREEFVRTKELGGENELIQGLIDGIPPDGGVEQGYSADPKANKLMEDGEKAFSTGRLDDALAAYQSALKIDPKIYHAALFSGDVFVQKGKYADAEIWYQKAIAIDPFVETAYRYSATPLMKQKKVDEARDRYIEAYITEPYNRLALSGIVSWGSTTGTRLGHPQIDVPEIQIGPDGKAKTVINVNPAADDGSLAWASYVATREAWRNDKFAKTFPSERAYRHTLKEEAEALRSVVAAAKGMKPKSMNAQIQTLSKLDEDGVLEAYILLARADNGIARDHHDYLRANRDKLRLYVSRYVVGAR